MQTISFTYEGSGDDTSIWTDYSKNCAVIGGRGTTYYYNPGGGSAGYGYTGMSGSKALTLAPVVRE